MNTKYKIQVSLRVFVIFALLFSIVPAQADTLQSQFTVISVPGTSIYVDGVFAAQSYTYYRMIIVPYGVHEIKVTKPLYYPSTKKVTISNPISSVFVGALTYKG